MLQIEVLQPASAAGVTNCHQFPVLIGRDAECQCRMTHPGVWGRHLLIELESSEGLFLSIPLGQTPRVSVNGTDLTGTRARMRNGDFIELGAVKLRLWLSPVRQNRFQIQERLVWFGLGSLLLLQAWLCFRLLAL